MSPSLYLVADICWGLRGCDFDNPERMQFLFDWTHEQSRRLADHPASHQSLFHASTFTLTKERPQLTPLLFQVAEAQLGNRKDSGIERAPNQLAADAYSCEIRL